MFEEMQSFQNAFAQVRPDGTAASAPIIRKRKSLKQRLVFWLVNLVLVLPAILVVYLTVVAEGLRLLLGVFGTRLSRTAIPGAGILEQFDGWNRVDIASVTALILCVTVSYVWFRVFNELSGRGDLAQGGTPQVVLLLLSIIAAILVIGDALIFYFGLSSQASSGWTETPQYVCVGATVLYSVGLAFLGAYHGDYHTSGEV